MMEQLEIEICYENSVRKQKDFISSGLCHLMDGQSLLRNVDTAETLWKEYSQKPIVQSQWKEYISLE